jgi:hypothetical protein
MKLSKVIEVNSQFLEAKVQQTHKLPMADALIYATARELHAGRKMRTSNRLKVQYLPKKLRS